MQVILCIVSVLFGGLSIIAAVCQIKTEKKSASALMMITGSLLLIAAVICSILVMRFDFIIALVGCAAICAAAILNGIKSKQLHIQHHIIRIALSIILIIGFIFR